MRWAVGNSLTFLKLVVATSDSSEYFTGISEFAPQHLFPGWTKQVTHAEHLHGDDVTAMDVYQARIPKPPGRREVEVELGQQELGDKNAGQASWLSHGLKVEEGQ